MKSELIAGDTLQFTTVVPDYPASAGWTLTYRLIPRTAGTAISFSGSASGDDYAIEVGASVTKDWVAGEYSWSAYVSKAGERHTVDQGTVKILDDPGVIAAYDGRSHARKTLDAIQAVIQNRATQDQKSYSIGGRSLERMPLSDLLKLESAYLTRVANEDAAASGGVAGPLGRIRYGVPR